MEGTYFTTFTYDATGKRTSRSCQRGNLMIRTEYYYIKNLQGDVIAIADAAGQIAGTYEYDTWGYLNGMYNSAGSFIREGADNILAINPIRYCGYYYDGFTKLYYLNSRYYDPETGRFLNADGYVSTGQEQIGYIY